MTPEVSIIITAFNSRGLLRQLLKGIYAMPPSHPFEVIVIDNDSHDGTEELVNKEFTQVMYIRNEKNLGLAYGNNVGIKKANGKYLLILNPDVAIFAGMCDKLIAFMESHPMAGIVGPKLMNPDKTLQYSTFLFPRWYTPILRRTAFGVIPHAQKYLKEYLMKSWDHASDRKVPWVLGAAMCINANALNKVELQDERFFLYFEDVDWCRRFWEHGYEVWYAHDIHFVHYHRRESAEHPGMQGINKITLIHMQSWIRYFKKYAKHPQPIIST